MNKIMNNLNIDTKMFKINLYFIEYSKFTSNWDIKAKHEVDVKVNLYTYSIDCHFTKFERIDEDKVRSSIKHFKLCMNIETLQNNVIILFEA